MSFSLGSVIAHIKADVSGFEQGIKTAQGKLDGFKGGIQKLDDSLSAIRTTATIVGGVAIAALGRFMGQASEEANQFQKAMITLEIVSAKFGVSADDAKNSANQLGRELRIGTGAAAESLQNLLKSGLGLDQAKELLKRFTNEAITGKSPTLSLSQAVQNLSFAYATNNSALGNMSGVSENFQDIIERGRQALIKEGVAVNTITDDMAKYKGMMELTNLTLGSSEKFTGTLIDKQAILAQKMLDLKIAVGEKLNPVLAEFYDKLIGFVQTNGDTIVAMFQKFLDVLVQFGSWVEANQELVIGFLKGLAVAFTALAIISFIVGAINLLFNPLSWLVILITALFVAWETNFLGIRDITKTVVDAIVWFFNEYLKPVFQGFSDWFTERWEYIKQMLSAAWENIKAVFQLALAFLLSIIAFFIAMFTGQWQLAWDLIKKAASMGWDALKKIFTSIVDFIIGWGGTVVGNLVKPFEDAWNRIKEFVNKIKDALDFTKRHSPSVVDIVKQGVDKVNRAMSGLEFSTTLAPNVAGLAVSNGGQNMQINDIHISLPGAIISDMATADRFAERMGNQIIKKLQSNVRF